jgi:hypothetical protein
MRACFVMTVIEKLLYIPLKKLLYKSTVFLRNTTPSVHEYLHSYHSNFVQKTAHKDQRLPYQATGPTRFCHPCCMLAEKKQILMYRRGDMVPSPP